MDSKAGFIRHDTQWLSENCLFSSLGPAELAEISGMLTRRSVPARTTVLHQGAAGSRMFSVLKGKVKVSIVSTRGKEAILAILGKGDFFGEGALFDFQERSATVTALEPTEMLEFDREAVFSVLLANPGVVVNILTAMSRRLRAANMVIEDNIFLDLPSRLAKKLVVLARDHGKRTPTGTRIDIPLTQQEFATLVGAARESVNRLLRSWDDQGVIVYENGYVTLIDTAKLEASIS